MSKIMISAAAAWVGFTPTPTYAAPVELDLSSGSIFRVYDGCGVSHRYGGCRPGGQAGGSVPGQAYPAGWHVGPAGREFSRS